MNVIKLDEPNIYQLAIEIGACTRNVVDAWESYPKNTTGFQLINAADAIFANISEGCGRQFYEGRKQFCYKSRSALLQTRYWVIEAAKRSLIAPDEQAMLLEKVQTLHRKLNSYIKKLKDNPGNNYFGVR